MPDYDAGFKIVAHTTGRQLAELAGVSCQRWQPIVSEVQMAERFATVPSRPAAVRSGSWSTWKPTPTGTAMRPGTS
jgi:hypothetical protein